jgi:putative transposase
MGPFALGLVAGVVPVIGILRHQRKRLSAPVFRQGGRPGRLQGDNDPGIFCFSSRRAESEGMGRDRGRKTFKFRLKPAPAQERALAVTVWRCRELYNAGLAERRAAWERCGTSVTVARQLAHLPGRKAVRLEYREINARALFRRVQAGEKPV